MIGDEDVMSAVGVAEEVISVSVWLTWLEVWDVACVLTDEGDSVVSVGRLASVDDAVFVVVSSSEEVYSVSVCGVIVVGVAVSSVDVLSPVDGACVVSVTSVAVVEDVDCTVVP